MYNYFYKIINAIPNILLPILLPIFFIGVAVFLILSISIIIISILMFFVWLFEKKGEGV